jgi:dipeptidyl-peptidase-4
VRPASSGWGVGVKLQAGRASIAAVRLDELSPEAIVERGQLQFGQPRAFSIARNGRRVAMLRSPDPTTAEQQLWLLERDPTGGWAERRIDRPEAAGDGSAPAESAAARAMRERTRELAGGIIAYTADADLDRIVFVAGGLWGYRTGDDSPLRVEGTDAAEAPLLSPDGRLLACVEERSVRVLTIEHAPTTLAVIDPDGEHEFLGRPDFIAAEELGRFEGMWWDPTSRWLLVQRTDDADLAEWTIANPGEPAARPQTVRYPVANGPNALLGLALLDTETGATRRVSWDTERYPYLVAVHWSAAGGLTLDVQTRDQKELATLAVDIAAGTGTQRAAIHDAHWVEPGNGTRAHGPNGELCQMLDRDGVRTLQIGQRVLDLPGHLVHIAGALDAGVLVTLAPTTVDRRVALARWDGTVEWLSEAAGVARAAGRGNVVVLEQRTLEQPRPELRVLDVGAAARGFAIPTHAEPLEWEERVELFTDLPDGGSSAALLLPFGYDPGRDGPLPVLLDPYGGPLFARVVRDRRAFAQARWLAEQGYAVLAIDGVGTPGRSPAWEREIAGELLKTLDSQVVGLEAVAARRPGVLDLDAVGIRGWSFGGYLSALAAIRRPDLFRAAAVGAPVSDWALYDTHYTERYLGHGPDFLDAAARNSLPDRIAEADVHGRPPSPMLLIHGFEDDNVVVAHSIRLAEALAARGVPHASLLLPSLTHVGRTSVVAQVQRIELDFLDRHLKAQ